MGAPGGRGGWRADCFGRGMRLNFKRLALLGAHVARPIAELIELTPARMDLLALLLNEALCQREIAARLCVSEGVVSRLVRVLMARGFVKRVIPNADRRFRVVSLTKFGRYRYLTLQNRNFIDDDGHADVQAIGEERWARDWRLPFLQMGLDSVREFWRCYDLPIGVTPPYAAMRRQILRRDLYDDPVLCDDSEVDDVAPFLVVDPAPRMHRGAIRDPLCDVLLENWKPTPGLAHLDRIPYDPRIVRD